MSDKSSFCPDCAGDDQSLNRRDFIKTTALASAAAASTTLAARTSLFAAETAKPKKDDSETLCTQLYNSLSDEQRKICTFAFDDPLRHRVENNWRITQARVGRPFDEHPKVSFNKDQQALIKEIFMKLHSEEYAETVYQQVEHDNGGGGFGACSVALFGQPGTGKFEFVFTGRHVTRRWDGDSVEGAAFGGPIFYGHAAQSFNEPPDHPGNAYWYQAKRANELFQALNGKQRKIALLDDARPEQGTQTVKLSGKTTDLAGIPLSELTPDQKELAEKVMQDVLAPFRKADVDECMKLIQANGLDHVHFSYYSNEELDVGQDGVWDVWQIEGPAMVWYFRGAPHVHTWVHIRESV